MTIEEAMVSLSVQLEIKSRVGNEEAADAIRLGIEALKQLRCNRDNRIKPYDFGVLPGETGRRSMSDETLERRIRTIVGTALAVYVSQPRNQKSQSPRKRSTGSPGSWSG